MVRKNEKPVKQYRPRRLIPLDIEYLKECALRLGSSTGLRARHKLAVLTRDGFKCVTCGKTEDLTIAHLVPAQAKKRNAAAYKPEACKTQCIDCHLAEEFGQGDLK